MNYPALLQLLRDEVVQRREEGCDVTGLDQEVASLLPGDIESAEALYQALDGLEPQPGFPYQEPVSYEGIRAARSCRPGWPKSRRVAAWPRRSATRSPPAAGAGPGRKPGTS